MVRDAEGLRRGGTDSGANASFREAFCHGYRCASEAFERELLIRCMPWPARWLGMIWMWLRPRSFERELGMLSRLGGARRADQLRSELEGYGYENGRDRPFRVVVLGVRLSRRRCLKVFHDVMR